MKAEICLKIITGISIIGMIFSGIMSYLEVFTDACTLERCNAIQGVPACVYGFIIYLIIFILSLMGLKSLGK